MQTFLLKGELIVTVGLKFVNWTLQHTKHLKIFIILGAAIHFTIKSLNAIKYCYCRLILAGQVGDYAQAKNVGVKMQIEDFEIK